MISYKKMKEDYYPTMNNWCLHRTDGPVTPFVILSRYTEAVACGLVPAEAASNWMAEIGIEEMGVENNLFSIDTPAYNTAD